MGTVRKSATRVKPAGSGGSRKGVPNKSTATAREAIARFVDGNTERLQGWLDEIAADEKHGPREAFRCMMDVMEYHVPKLARTEHVGDNGGAIQTISRVELIPLLSGNRTD